MAGLLNLVVPGAGLIVRGAVGSGLLCGLLFAACANLTLAACLLFPDEMSASGRTLALVITGVVYVLVQVRMAQITGLAARRTKEQFRRERLLRVQECLRREDVAGALEAIEPLMDSAGTDLLVAFRVAEVLTLADDQEGARAAWANVRALDRHGIYRAQMPHGLHA
jgi:hypothetical protein